MKTFLLFTFCFLLNSLAAQPLVTRSGYAAFFSETPLEDIKAENRQVHAVIDPAKKNAGICAIDERFFI